MPRFPPTRIRLLSAVCGCFLSLATLVAAVALFTGSLVTPVGVVVAGLVSAATVSLPVWAAGILYSLSKDSLGLGQQSERILYSVAVAAVGLFLLGFAAVLSQTEPLRTIGDGMYVVATVLLFVLSTILLLVGVRRRDTLV